MQPVATAVVSVYSTFIIFKWQSNEDWIQVHNKELIRFTLIQFGSACIHGLQNNIWRKQRIDDYIINMIPTSNYIILKGYMCLINMITQIYPSQEFPKRTSHIPSYGVSKSSDREPQKPKQRRAPEASGRIALPRRFLRAAALPPARLRDWALGWPRRPLAHRGAALQGSAPTR